MKKKLFVPLSIIVIALMMISATSIARAASNQTIELRLAHGWSPKVAEAHAMLQRGRVKGKIVLEI